MKTKSNLVQYSIFDVAAPEAITESWNDQQRRLIAERDGVSPDCKHLSIWNKVACPDDCDDCAGCQEFTDGITPDSFEKIKVELPKKMKDTAEVSLALGGSGSWYMGYSVHSSATQGGKGFSAWPKFSKQYDSRYRAFCAASDQILDYFRKNKMKVGELQTLRKALEAIATGMNPEEFRCDSICNEWRECGYGQKCMSQDESGDVVCFKDQLKKEAGDNVEVSLSDLCQQCHTASFCAGCCVSCSEPCNAKQNCSWPSAQGVSK